MFDTNTNRKGCTTMETRNWKRWTKDELDYLRAHYLKDSIEDIVKYLGRTKSVVVQQASNHRIAHPIRQKVMNKPAYTLWYYLGYRKNGLCKEWKDLAVFTSWLLLNNWEPHKVLMRKDTHLGWNPDNCMVVDKEFFHKWYRDKQISEDIVKAILVAKFVQKKNNVDIYSMYPHIPRINIYNIIIRRTWKEVQYE